MESNQPTGVCLLTNPHQNKGVSFGSSERDDLKLRGLVPPGTRTQDAQAAVAIDIIRRMENGLWKYVYLRGIQDSDERLFYRLLNDFTEELMPIVYTPVVGEACQRYSHIYVRPRGIFIGICDAGNVADILDHWPEEDVRAIVVTDGERILGLGDLGTNGMGIPVGKLSLYTALAGIPPRTLLPVTLDVGTNNETFLNDPAYIGLRQKRVRGPAYDDLIDEFITAATAKWSAECLIQFEDFGNSNADRLLKKYENKICTFNDDIQGTASVVVSGILSSLNITGMKLAEHRFLFYGAGEAALGTADLLTMALEEEGLDNMESRRRIWMIDSKGLITQGRPGGVDEHKERYAQDADTATDLETIVDIVKPTSIIGLAARPGVFTEAVLKKVASYSLRPLVFPLSNPTSKAECTAEQAYRATDGQCIFASGSPFDPVTIDGTTFIPGQGNNSYIFPGVALGVIACRAKRIPQQTFLVAARTLTKQVSEANLEAGRIYPPLDHIKDVSRAIGAEVAKYLYKMQVATVMPEPEDKLELVTAMQYNYSY